MIRTTPSRIARPERDDVRRALAASGKWITVQHGGAPRWFLVAVALFLAVVSVIVGTRWGSVATASSERPRWYAESDGPRPVVTIIGDSYTAGTRYDSGPDAEWPANLYVGERIRVVQQARGGSGYVNLGRTGAPFSLELTRVWPESDVIVVFGSVNDRQGYDAVRAAAAELYAGLRQIAPDAEIVAVGPPWIDDEVPQRIVEDRDAVRDAAAEARITFVDALDERWLRDAPALIAPDNLHPNDAGHADLAAKMSPIIEKALYRSRR